MIGEVRGKPGLRIGDHEVVAGGRLHEGGVGQLAMLVPVEQKELGDLAERPLDGPYDLITAFDAVHDQRDPAGLLAAVRGALASDGVFLMQDIAGSSELHRNFDHPVAPLLYAVSTAHCTCVSLGQGGPGLGTMWGEELAGEMLRDAGFGSVDKRRLGHDFMNVYYIARPADA